MEKFKKIVATLVENEEVVFECLSEEAAAKLLEEFPDPGSREDIAKRMVRALQVLVGSDSDMYQAIYQWNSAVVTYSDYKTDDADFLNLYDAFLNNMMIPWAHF